MSEPFIAEVRMVAFTFPPKSWALCNGQVLPINQNQALFSLLGTTYGGNGSTNFALPDLRGRAPVHIGSTTVQGQVGGTQSHTLSLNETPAHTHSVIGDSKPANALTPGGNLFSQSAIYTGTPPGTTLAPAALSAIGGGQSHENRQPFLVVNYCIALTGIFPSRN